MRTKALTVLALAAAFAWSGAAAAAPPATLHDSAVGSGSTASFSAFNFDVSSDASGENPTGVTTTDAFGIHFVGTSVTCFAANGNSATFAGELAPNFFQFTHFKVTVTDNGPAGSGLDTYAANGFTTAQDCSTAVSPGQPLTAGDIAVIDAPPTSRAQCVNGGYARFGFANEGLCIGYVQYVAADVHTATFSNTGSEQRFTVPGGVSAVTVTATGAAGGGPTSGSLAAGRGAVVTASLAVTPGEVLYVEVGGIGDQPSGGFNGGGNGGVTPFGLSGRGGGGASDIRLVARADTGTLASRVLVAAGGGGSASPAASGGDAGAAGGNSPGSTTAGGGAGTDIAGGAGGCTPLNIGCGTPGVLGIGGDGGHSGEAAAQREGSGGGGGLYGGGGGAGVLDGSVGGGGGGSSLLPSGGTLGLAELTTAPRVVITYSHSG